MFDYEILNIHEINEYYADNKVISVCDGDNMRVHVEDEE
ncbi:MAG: hypothetical protein [Caudoviricetes sp.]|nr:MAG: hypothetical protein [Caudoviricetes sp.]